MLFILTYDSPSTPAGDRRRARLARFLSGHGLRVQLSVFELEVPPEEMPRLYRQMEDMIEPREDSVRVYANCAACAGRALRVGRQAPCEHGALIFW